MNPLLLFLAAAIPSFAAGVWVRPYLDRIIAETRSHMPHAERSRAGRIVANMTASTTILVMLVVVAVVACAALIYTVQAKRSLDACLTALLDESGANSRTVRAATIERDEAELRLLDEIVHSEDVPEQERLYKEFADVSADLNKTRSQQPIFTFTEYCRTIAEGGTWTGK